MREYDDILEEIALKFVKVFDFLQKQNTKDQK